MSSLVTANDKLRLQVEPKDEDGWRRERDKRSWVDTVRTIEMAVA